MNKQTVNPTCLFKRTFFLLVMLAAHSGLMAQCPGNPINNPGFENGLTGWTNFGAGGITNDAYSGSQALELCAAPGGDNRVLQGLPVTPGNNVEFKFFGKKSVNNEFFSGYVKYLTSSFQPINPIEFEAITTMDFAEFSISSTAPSNAAYIEIGFIASANAATCAVVDEVCLTEGTGTPCDITASVSNITCDDNGTPNDPDDDTYGYQLLVTNGSQTGAFGIFNGGIQGASGNYGVPITFSGALIIAAPFNPNSFIVRDAADPACFTTYSIFPPAPCSNVGAVCPGDITLSSQAEVDAWAGCTIVEGDLRIAGNDITDLSPLSTLQKVRGALFLQNNTSLVNIDGLENVDSVDALLIIDNPLLESIDELGGLNQTGIASIVVSGNSSLTSIDIFNNFTSADNIEILENEGLVSFTGFTNLQTSNGKILFIENSNLSTLSGFQNLTSINSQLLFIQNSSLVAISGFGQLESIADELVFSVSTQLKNLDNFGNLNSVGTLVLINNGALEQINGLSSLSTVSNNLDITNNPMLSDCCGLYPILNSGGVGGAINISGNPMPCSNGTDILDNCVPSGDIDLSLSMNQPNATPSQWSNYEVNLTVQNSGGQTATGVEVSFAKPAGVVYTGGNEFDASQGTFSAFSNEVWTVGSIPAGGSATLTVSYFLLVSESPVAWAEVSAANETDADSTPGQWNFTCGK